MRASWRRADALDLRKSCSPRRNVSLMRKSDAAGRVRFEPCNKGSGNSLSIQFFSLKVVRTDRERRPVVTFGEIERSRRWIVASWVFPDF